MNITVLAENSACEGLECEHGLSLLIEYGGKKILLDAGTTDLFARNAQRLGEALCEVDMAVLSHGHYDHSGGFERFFEINTRANLYINEHAGAKYYSARGGMHEIGVPQAVLDREERIVKTRGVTKLMEGVYAVAHDTPQLERIGERAGLYRLDEQSGELAADAFAHEQSLVFETAQGLVVINSCSHGGAANIVREARQACGGRPIRTYIGGLHMKGTKDGKEICTFTEAELDTLCEMILREKIQAVYTGHCTGLPGTQALKQRLGERIRKLTGGMRIEIEEKD